MLALYISFYLFVSSLTHVPFLVPTFRFQKSMACPKTPSERSTKNAREGESLLPEGDQLHSGGICLRRELAHESKAQFVGRDLAALQGSSG